MGCRAGTGGKWSWLHGFVLDKSWCVGGMCHTVCNLAKCARPPLWQHYFLYVMWSLGMQFDMCTAEVYVLDDGSRFWTQLDMILDSRVM
jgi:hypothetical protein